MTTQNSWVEAVTTESRSEAEHYLALHEDTLRLHRQMGYARATMCPMLKDCRDVYGHTKSVLFTGESDIAAQKLYESIGYARSGEFALILGT